MPLRGLIFDFDGVIVDTETATLDAWRQVHAEDGFFADPRVLHAFVGHVDIAGDIWTSYPETYDRSSLSARFLDYTRRLCREAPVLPGVLQLLDAARDAGLRLAVASNSSHRHVDGHLSARGLLERFQTVVCREDVPHGKPAPDLYLAALERLGLDAPEAVAFEDSLPGHEAAAAAGLRVVVVPNPSTAGDHFPRATLRLDSLAETNLEFLATLKPFA
jgi:putative hydrolase of the HAD superfamily